MCKQSQSQYLLWFTSISLVFFPHLFKYSINYFIIVKMEEKFNVQESEINEGQDTLLSCKIGKLGKSLPTKALISQLISKQQNIYTPIIYLHSNTFTKLNTFTRYQTQTRNYSPKSRQQISKTQYFEPKRDKRHSTQSNQEPFNQNQKNSNERITYKFIKYSTNDTKGFRTIYEQKISSIHDINGNGFLILSDGRLLQGSWIEGVPRGNMKIQYPNGLIYYGYVYDYRPHGEGYLYYPDNRKYEGEFCYGEFHGPGIYYDENNQIKKQGEWKHGKYIAQ